MPRVENVPLVILLMIVVYGIILSIFSCRLPILSNSGYGIAGFEQIAF
jgi:thiol:disulfide interchange protein